MIHDTIHCTNHSSGFVPPLWAMVAESVSSLLVMINFSSNFLIYCSTLKPFRAYLAGWWVACTKLAARSVPGFAGGAARGGGEGGHHHAETLGTTLTTVVGSNKSTGGTNTPATAANGKRPNWFDVKDCGQGFFWQSFKKSRA